MYRDHIDEFRDAIARDGITPPERIIPDGKIHRFPTSSRPRDDAGWYVFYPDGIPAGAYGCFRAGLKGKWCSKNPSLLTPAEREEYRRRIEDAQNQAELERARAAEEAAQRTAQIWSAATRAVDHPYLAAKGVGAHGVRIHDGDIVVPMRNAAGQLRSIQRISPRGDKLFLPGAPVRGLYHSIGQPNGVICVVEGYATGASIHEATGHAVAVAFSAANLTPVAQALRRKYPDADIILCGDHDANGTGQRAAEEAARAVAGKVAIPPAGDWNDAYRRDGAEAVRRGIAAARPAEPETRHRAATVRVSDIEPQPIRWLWPGRIARGKVSLIAGDPGLGKSLVTLAMAAVVTRGGRWPVDGGHAPQGDVILLSAEDDVADTIRPRLEAAGADVRRIYAITMVRDVDPATGTEVPRTFSLRRDIPVLGELITRYPEAKLVVIDPITAYTDGTDTHRNADVRGLLAPLAELAQRTGVAVVCVTHLNKAGGQSAIYRTTGSLAFVAAARSAMLVTRDPDDPARRLLLSAKNNLAPDSAGLAYRVGVAETGAPRVEWEAEPVTITADEALSALDAQRVSGEDRSALGDAMDWLRELLAEGPVPAQQVRREAEDAGYAWATIRRAQERLGVEICRQGFGREGTWVWALPAQTAELEKQEERV